MALDIANPGAPPILAADSGTVSYAGCLSWGYGCYVIIDHGNGYQTLYAHLSRYSVSSGQSVSQGQTIGIMGSTGRSTGVHLHFEIRREGQLLNPLNFLK
jgi:murein DD-endopeptidase MepM/ murein hydrolase activator NlpD